VVTKTPKQLRVRKNNPKGNVLHNFRKALRFLLLLDQLIGQPHFTKKPDELNIFVSNTPSNIYFTTNNLLEPSSDHSTVLLNVSAALPIRSCSSKLFHEFHVLINQNINLKIIVKPPKKLMMPLIILRLLFILQHGKLLLHTGST